MMGERRVHNSKSTGFSLTPLITIVMQKLLDSGNIPQRTHTKIMVTNKVRGFVVVHILKATTHINQSSSVSV
jgi:hypothetical protein